MFVATTCFGAIRAKSSPGGGTLIDFDHGWMERRAPLLSCIDLLSVGHDVR
jgi:hypothetical protein